MAKQPKFKIGDIVTTCGEAAASRGIVQGIVVDKTYGAYHKWFYELDHNKGAWWEHHLRLSHTQSTDPNLYDDVLACQEAYSGITKDKLNT